MQVMLVMFKADGTRRDFPLSKPRIVIGRKNTCDLRIPLSSVSRQHCEIRISEDLVSLRDLGSSNGTYHNSIRVQETELEAGDKVVIGPVVFVVVIDGKPAHIEPIRSTMPGSNPSLDESPALAGVHADDDDNDSPHTMVGQESADKNHGEDLAAGTVDMDDDPIAALERLAEAERADSTESDFDFDIDLEEDDDSKR